MTMDLHKKNKNEKTNSSTVLPILLEPRKEGWQCSNIFGRNT